MSSKNREGIFVALSIVLSAIAPIVLIPIVGGGAYIGVQALRGVPLEQSVEQFSSFIPIVTANTMIITYFVLASIFLPRYKAVVIEGWREYASKLRFVLQASVLGVGAFCLNGLTLLLLSAAGILGRDSLFATDDRSMILAIIYWFSFIVMAPIAEGLLFRYLMQNWLKKYSLILELLAPSIVNALLYFGGNPALLIPYTLMFLCYAAAYHRSGNITLLITAHVVTNALIIVAGFLL